MMIWSSQRRRVAAAAGLMSVALLASGCGDDGTESPGAGASTSPDAEAPAGDGETYVLRYTTPLPEGAGAEKMTQLWADAVFERTNGQVVLEPHYVESLAKGPETLQALSDGRADAGYLANVFFEKQMPLFAIAGVPFVTKNGPALAATMQDMYDNNEAFRAEFDRYKVKPMFFLPLPAAGAGLTEPISGIDSLNGKRLRSYGFIAEAIQAVGANPVFLTSPEIFEGIERKTIDGFLPLAWDQAVDNGLAEVAPYFFDAGTGQFAAVAIAVGTDALDEIPQDLQDEMDAAARDIAPDLVALLTENETKACGKLLEQGGSMTILSQDEISAWDDEAHFDAYIDTWADRAQAEGLDAQVISDFRSEYESALDDHTSEMDYEEGMIACADR